VTNSEFSEDFTYYLLDVESERISKLAGKQAVPIINKTQFSSVKVLVPGLAEQKRIADCLSSLDSQIAAESSRLSAFNTHKQGLMQQLLLLPEQGL
jgi:type I restriction enzyme S subunit